jgi:hypothetical protein
MLFISLSLLAFHVGASSDSVEVTSMLQLQRRGVNFQDGQTSRQIPNDNFMKVDYLYTFAAAPSKKNSGFKNGQAADGCWSGMRTFGRNALGWPDFVPKAQWDYHHPEMDVLEIQVDKDATQAFKEANRNQPFANTQLDDQGQFGFTSDETRRNRPLAFDIIDGDYQTYKCADKHPGKLKLDNSELDTSKKLTQFPNDAIFCLSGYCHINLYYFNYPKIKERLAWTDESVANPDFGELFWLYGTNKDTEALWNFEKSMELARQNGYRVVGAATVTNPKWWTADQDRQMLYQKIDAPRKNSCVLAIEGSDMSIGDYADNLNWVTGRNFCGFKDVQPGYTDATRMMIRNSNYTWNIKTKLPFCDGLTVTGHSQGGALAHIFSACVNSNRAETEVEDDQHDYNTIKWERRTPVELPEVSAEDFPYWRN